MTDMTQFLEDRKTAFLSMHKPIIEAYMRKYEVPIPSDEHTFWISVHMARTGAKDLPMNERAVSKSWLGSRGYRSMDDGDVPEGVEG